MGVAVVTGANKGIGLAIVRSLCEKYDGDVLLTSRDEARGQAAMDTLRGEGLEPKYHLLDICEEQSVLRLRDFLEKEYGGLDILVNNAGIISKSETLRGGARETVETNYWANKAVCRLLFPLLRPGARVVNLSSAAGFLGHLSKGLPQLSVSPGHPQMAEQLTRTLSSASLTEQELDTLMADFVAAAEDGRHHSEGWLDNAYFVSKIGWSALTRIQARQMEADPRNDIVINHVHPGYVSTDINNHTGHLDIDRGAQSSVFAALLPPNTQAESQQN